MVLPYFLDNSNIQHTQFEIDFFKNAAAILVSTDDFNSSSQELKIVYINKLMNFYIDNDITNLNYNNCKRFIDNVYERCLKYESNIENGECDKSSYGVVSNFMKTIKKLKQLLLPMIVV